MLPSLPSIISSTISSIPSFLTSSSIEPIPWEGFITPSYCQTIQTLVKDLLPQSRNGNSINSANRGDGISSACFGSTNRGDGMCTTYCGAILGGATITSNHTSTWAIITPCPSVDWPLPEFDVAAVLSSMYSTPIAWIVFPHTAGPTAASFDLHPSLIYSILMKLTDSCLPCRLVLAAVPKGLYIFSYRNANHLFQSGGNGPVAINVCTLVEGALAIGESMNRAAIVKSVLNNPHLCTHFYPFAKIVKNGCAHYLHTNKDMTKQYRKSRNNGNNGNNRNDRNDSLYADDESITSQSSHTSYYNDNWREIVQEPIVPIVQEAMIPMIPMIPMVQQPQQAISSQQVISSQQPSKIITQEEKLAILIRHLYADYDTETQSRLYDDHLTLMKILSPQLSNDPFVRQYQIFMNQL